MVAAQRKRCAVWSIELYPIWGITRFDEPYSRYDHCIIAWGGVVAARLPGVAAYVLQTIIFTPRQTRAGVEILGVKRYLGDVQPSGVRF